MRSRAAGDTVSPLLKFCLWQTSQRSPAIELGFFVRARNATAARAGPNGTAWTLLAGSVVYGKTPAARASIPSLCWWVARDLIGETGAMGRQRWDGLRRTGGERPTHADVAQSVRAPSFQVGGSGFESLYLLQFRYVLLRTFARSLNRASTGLFFLPPLRGYRVCPTCQTNQTPGRLLLRG